MTTVYCPCGAKYKVPEEKLGLTARCRKCGQQLLLHDRDPESAPIPLAEPSPLSDEIASAAQRSLEAERGLKTRDERRFTVRPEDFGYTPGGDSDERAGGRLAPAMKAAPPGSYANFFQALGWNFLFIASPHNLTVVLAVWVVMGLLRLSSFGGFLFIIGFILVNGWYCAFLFNTISAAANGEEELPKLGQAFDDLWEGAVLPLMRYVVCSLLVVVPAALYLIYIFMRVSQAEALELTDVFRGALVYKDWSLFLSSLDARIATLVLCILLGLFLWPMNLLVAGLGGVLALVRMDLILATIARTFPAYLAVVVLIFTAFFLGALAGSFLANRTGASILTVGAVMLMVSIYLDIVAMRAIGLCYHHFKNCFAWSWG